LLDPFVGRWIKKTATGNIFELTFSRSGEDLVGIIEQITPTGDRKQIASYEIVFGRGRAILNLREEGKTYQFKASLLQRDIVRFERRLAKPGFFGVELMIPSDGRLVIAKRIGVNDGMVPAEVDFLRFERASGRTTE